MEDQKGKNVEKKIKEMKKRENGEVKTQKMKVGKNGTLYFRNKDKINSSNSQR